MGVTFRNLLVVALAALTFVASASAHPMAPPPIRTALHAEFGHGREYRIAACIAWHESHFRPTAVSSTDDYGVMQINRKAHHDIAVFELTPGVWPIFRPAYNVKVAKIIYDDAIRRLGWSERWTPWHTYPLCRGVA